MFSTKIFINHNNSWLYAENFKYSNRAFQEISSNPNLVPNDIHLFLKLKEYLGIKQFKSDEDLKDAEMFSPKDTGLRKILELH